MSFRSNFLLQRSSDLKAENGGNGGGDRLLVLLVAREDAQLEELAALFEKVDLEILSAREETVALEKIRMEQPILVISRFPLQAKGYRMARRQSKDGNPILVLVPTEKVDDATGRLTAEQLTPLLNLIAGQTLPPPEAEPSAEEESATEDSTAESGSGVEEDAEEFAEPEEEAKSGGRGPEASEGDDAVGKEMGSAEPRDEPEMKSSREKGEEKVEGPSDEEFFREEEQWLAQPDSTGEEDSIERTFDLVDPEEESPESLRKVPVEGADDSVQSAEGGLEDESGSKAAKIREYLEEFQRLKSQESIEPRRVSEPERGFDDLFVRFFEAESVARASRRNEKDPKPEAESREGSAQSGDHPQDFEDETFREQEESSPQLSDQEDDESEQEEILRRESEGQERQEFLTEEDLLEPASELDAEELQEQEEPPEEELSEEEEPFLESLRPIAPPSEGDAPEMEEASLLEKSLERKRPSFLDEITRQELEKAVTEEGLNREREMAEWVSPELEDLYLQAVTYVLRSIRTADGQALPDLEEGAGIVAALLDALDEDTDLLLAATNREQEFAVSTHSANVAILSLWIAAAAGSSPSEVSRIGLAALLHEVGVVKLPESIIHREDDLDEEQLRVLRKRPLYSREVLEAAESGYQWLPEVVGQVYERSNGTGYPLGLSDHEIVSDAKIIGIADVIEACIHRRPYREALTGYQALFELTTEHARSFPDQVVKAAIRSLSLYPYNEYVVLDSGEIGQVKAINEDNLSRPCIQILFDASGERVSGERLEDLSQNSSAYIAKAIRSCDLPEPVGD